MVFKMEPMTTNTTDNIFGGGFENDGNKPPGASNGGGDINANFSALRQVPQLLGNVRSGVLALKSLVHAPQAAMASGNPAVGGAIVALGAQLLVFLYQTVQAIDDDIDAIRKVADNYEAQEQRVVQGAQQAMGAIDSCSTAMQPALSTSLN